MIRGRYLEALEDERFDQLPAGPYARSFLREYAEFLGLDGDMLANEYALRYEQPAEPEQPTPLPLSRADGVMRWLDGVPMRRFAVALGVAALVAVAVIELGNTGGGSTPPAARSTTTSPPARTRTTPRAAGHAKKTVPATAAPASLMLTAARGRCWLSVHVGSSTGTTVYQATLEQGQTVRFGLRKPLWIRIGAPEYLDARIGSRSVTLSLPGRTGDVLVSRRGVQQAP